MDAFDFLTKAHPLWYVLFGVIAGAVWRWTVKSVIWRRELPPVPRLSDSPPIQPGNDESPEPSERGEPLVFLNGMLQMRGGDYEYDGANELYFHTPLMGGPNPDSIQVVGDGRRVTVPVVEHLPAGEPIEFSWDGSDAGPGLVEAGPDPVEPPEPEPEVDRQTAWERLGGDDPF